METRRIVTALSNMVHWRRLLQKWQKPYTKNPLSRSANRSTRHFTPPRNKISKIMYYTPSKWQQSIVLREKA